MYCLTNKVKFILAIHPHRKQGWNSQEDFTKKGIIEPNL